MRLKSYFAGTVESAIRLARQELGEDAMLMSSRKALPEARYLGEYEIVFAVDDAALQPAVKAAPGPALTADPVAGEVAEIRRQLRRMETAVCRSSSFLAGRLLVKTESIEAFSILTSNDVDPDLALSVIQRVDAIATAGSDDFHQALVKEIGSRFSVSGEVQDQLAVPRVLALVGPPGVGKTTTLIKLAVNYGIASRRPVQLLSIDMHRIAATDQLRRYAAILGLGFEALETVGELGQAVEEHRNKDLILIDTPGHSPKDLDLAEHLAHFLSQHRQIETHLVLSCSIKSSDLSSVMDRFERFRPSKLLFTKVDETDAHGPMLNQAARKQWPISFLTTGQQVPEDIEPATKTRVIELLLRGQSTRALATKNAAA
jgi:flagellar biosynthesis protein FlhF